jgi:hypothetical protein
MFLLAGVLPIAIAVIAVLHVAIFRKMKSRWISWFALIIVSGGMIALLGAGALHAGLIGLVTFIIGFFWLLFLKTSVGKDTYKAKL